MEILIETLKKIHVESSARCDDQYKEINAYLKAGDFKKANEVRKGYEDLWNKVNRMEDFVKNNDINYYTNFGESKISDPNIY